MSTSHHTGRHWLGRLDELTILAADAWRPQSSGMGRMAASHYSSPDWAIARACYHEAGHAAAFRSNGAEPEIHINADGSGLCVGSLHDIPQPRRTLIALAGPIAMLAAQHGNPGSVADITRQLRAPDFLSGSDRRLAGTFGEHDVAFAARFVQAKWADIQHEAKWLAKRFCRQSGLDFA